MGAVCGGVRGGGGGSDGGQRIWCRELDVVFHAYTVSLSSVTD